MHALTNEARKKKINRANESDTLFGKKDENVFPWNDAHIIGNGCF